jgi:prepilin-type N-terminal cleavage/methylation domain-containing protein
VLKKGYSLVEVVIVLVILSFFTFLGVKLFSSVTSNTSDAYSKQILDNVSNTLAQNYLTRGYWFTSSSEFENAVTNVSFSNNPSNDLNTVVYSNEVDGVKLAIMTKAGNCLTSYVTKDDIKENKYYPDNNVCEATEAI